MPNTKLDFEKSLTELEKIVEKLQGENISLDESIALFEEGMKHTKNCRDALAKAEAKITEITGSSEEDIDD